MPTSTKPQDDDELVVPETGGVVPNRGLGTGVFELLATATRSGVVAAAGTGATKIGGIGDVATEATETNDLARSSKPRFAISSAKKMIVTILAVALQDYQYVFYWTQQKLIIWTFQ